MNAFLFKIYVAPSITTNNRLFVMKRKMFERISLKIVFHLLLYH